MSVLAAPGPARHAPVMSSRLPSPGPDRVRALVAVLLIALAALLATGDPSAAALPGAAVGSDEGPDPVGRWPLRPVPQVVRGFDPPGSLWGPGHRGVDLLGRVGQAVYAALPGRVSFAGVLAGRGVVVVDHGTTRTTYEPVAAAVEVSAQVAAGDRIGTLEVVESHCLPRACLHWGWIHNADDVYLDPLRLVGGQQPVRLLPLWRARPAEQPVGPAPRVDPWISPLARWWAALHSLW